MNKKILSFVLAITLIASLFTIPAFGAADASNTVGDGAMMYLEAVENNDGLVEVTAYAEGAIGLTGFEFAFNYDKNAVTPVKIADTSAVLPEDSMIYDEADALEYVEKLATTGNMGGYAMSPATIEETNALIAIGYTSTSATAADPIVLEKGDKLALFKMVFQKNGALSEDTFQFGHDEISYTRVYDIRNTKNQVIITYDEVTDVPAEKAVWMPDLFQIKTDFQKPAEPTVTAIEAVNFDFYSGEKEFADIELPETVKATLSDGSTIETTVAWANQSTPAYDKNAVNTYVVEGTITVPAGVLNTGDLKAKANIEVRKIKVAQETIDMTAKITVGTAQEDVVALLPTEVSAELENGQKATFEITWGEVKDYNGEESGSTFTVEGTLSTEDETIDASSAKVLLTGTVIDPFVVESVTWGDAEDTYTVDAYQYDTFEAMVEGLALPSKATVTLKKDGEADRADVERDIIWTAKEGFTVYKDSTIVGTLALEEDEIGNAGNDQKEIVITVNAVSISDETDLSKPIVPENDIYQGTEEAAVKAQLPTTATVVVTVGEGKKEVEVPVNWDMSTYKADAAVGEEQTIVGTLDYEAAGIIAVEDKYKTVNAIVVFAERAIKEIKVADATIAYVESIEDINTLTELAKKATVVAGDDNKEYADVAITWTLKDGGIKIASVPAEGAVYDVVASIVTLPEGTVQPESAVTGAAKLTVQASVDQYVITKVTTVSKTAKKGTSFSTLNLPEKVSIEGKNAAGETKKGKAEVIWDKDAYSSSKTTKQTITGELILEEPFVQSDPEMVAIAEVKLSSSTGGSTSDKDDDKDSSNDVTIILPPVVTPPSTEKPRAFTDIDNYPYAYDSIYALVDREIVSGTSSTTYSPARNITRAEFTKLVVELFNFTQNASNVRGFADVNDADWFASYVKTAASVGIINGVDDTHFDPNANITREQAAVILVRATEVSGRTIPQAGAAITFADTISDYAVAAVEKLVKANVISGMGDGTFGGQNNLIRADAACLIARLINTLGM